MKKLAILAVLAASMTAASALEVGIRGGRVGGIDTTDIGFNTAGVTLGQQYGKFGVEAAFDRSTIGVANINRYSVVGSYPVMQFAGVQFTGKAGAAYLDPSLGQDGYAALVGAGASYPLTKQVSLVADYAYQMGQDRVKALNGNQFSFGAKYSF
jgi:opacity protein-like surface antigen